MFRKHPYLWTTILLALTFVFSVGLGSVSIQATTVIGVLLERLPYLDVAQAWPDSFETIIFKVRLPHTILIAITGAALGGSGAAYQGLFRNPLADPYIIGVASGAGLGAVAAMALHWPEGWLGYYWIPLGAFVGALVTILLVYNLARVGRMIPLTTLILSGVAIGTFNSAVTSFLMLRSNEQIHRAISFLLGGSTMSGWRPVVAALPYMALGVVLLIFSGHLLNVLQFGEEQAKQMGLSVERAKFFVVVTASLTTAVAVSFSGVIGFVGLIVPHLMRMFWGPDYRRLIPLSILAGSSVLLGADLLARILIAPQVLPVGIVTALVGTPFFLWVLRRAKTEVFW
jgi:iron complex transport system permease protein